MNIPVNSVDGLSALLDRQKQAVVGAGTVSAEVRRERIQQVINMVVAEHKSLVAAMAVDFGGRAESFSLMNDVLGSLGSLKHTRDHLDSWLPPQSRTPFAPYDQLGAQAKVMGETYSTAELLSCRRIVMTLRGEVPANKKWLIEKCGCHGSA